MVINMKVNVNFQNSIQLNDNIYIDPYKLDNYIEAKYIFITHSHYDHFSPSDIEKIVNDDTKIIIPKDCYNELINMGINSNNIIVVEPNKDYKVDDITFSTVPSYNINKAFHPKENNWVGYLITIDNEVSYIVGDSDYIPEMKDIKCDNLFVPIGGIYTMNVDEAIELIREINPNIVYPTHYGPVVPNSDKNGIILQEKLNGSYNVKLFL